MPTALTWERLAQWMLPLATGSLLFRENFITSTPLTNRLFEIFIGLSTIFTLILLFRSPEARKQFKQSASRPVIVLAVMALGLVLGTAVTYFYLHYEIDIEYVKAFSRFVLAAITLLLIVFHCRREPKLRRFILFSFLIPLVYLVLLAFPQLASGTELTDADPNSYAIGRLKGFDKFPSNPGLLLVLTISVLSYFFLAQKNRKSIWLYCLLVGAFGLLIWTESRGSFLGAVVSIACITLLSRIGAKKSTAYGLGFAAAAVLAFMFLPGAIQKDFTLRIWPQYGTEFFPYHSSTASKSSVVLIRQIIADTPLPSSQALFPRTYLWSEYSKFTLRYPLGVGPAMPEALIIKTNGVPQGPHNTPLEMLATGGPLYLFGFIYLLFLGYRSARQHLPSPEAIIIMGALTGILVTAFFDNFFVNRVLWAVTALALSFPFMESCPSATENS